MLHTSCVGTCPLQMLLTPYGLLKKILGQVWKKWCLLYPGLPSLLFSVILHKHGTSSTFMLSLKHSAAQAANCVTVIVAVFWVLQNFEEAQCRKQDPWKCPNNFPVEWTLLSRALGIRENPAAMNMQTKNMRKSFWSYGLYKYTNTFFLGICSESTQATLSSWDTLAKAPSNQPSLRAGDSVVCL